MDNSNYFGFEHKAGILMPVFSLPSKYGIGSFGKECYKFIDFLSKTNQKVWQVLPLNPTSYGDSPYQSPSTFAGNPYFIDLDILAEDGLISKKDLQEYIFEEPSINYGRLFVTRYEILRKAYKKFLKGINFYNFLEENKYWIDDYSLFMALKVKNDYRAFYEWNNEEKHYLSALKLKESLKDEMNFWKFLQYEFFKQWKVVLDYAHSKDIQIVGDLPIYVAYDSVDVWCKQENFLLDYDMNPKLVAGCPPDAFSDDGQLWGNPIYNWEFQFKDGYTWWINRFEHTKKLYDIVRVDHFRAFAGYYCIPFGDKTAKNGYWVDGPRYEFFKTIKRNVPKLKIIAEDLGYITDDVRELMKQTKYPGMKVLQFAFDKETNEYLPKNYKNENCIVYTGTHDNETSLGFVKGLKSKALKIFNNNCKNEYFDTKLDSIIYAALNSKATLCIIPIADYLKLDNKGRINIPSVPMNNWVYMLKKDYNNSNLINRINYFIKLTNRD